jgi:hypothetical protein
MMDFAEYLFCFYQKTGNFATKINGNVMKDKANQV